MNRFTPRQLGLAFAVVVALVAGIAWGLGSGDGSSGNEISADATTTTDDATTTPEKETNRTSTTAGDDSDGSGSTGTPPGGSGSDALAGPSVGPFVLTSRATCESEVAPQVVVNVTDGGFANTGTAQTEVLSLDDPVTAMEGTTLDAPAGTDHRVMITVQDHRSGFLEHRTETSAGDKSIVVPATGDHVEWAFDYRLTFADGGVTISDVVLSVTGCEEMVVLQVRVVLEQPGQASETLLDTGNTTQRTLVAGEPLTVAGPVELPEVADGATLRVFFFDHATSRTAETVHDADGDFTQIVPVNQEGPAWTLRYPIAGLG